MPSRPFANAWRASSLYYKARWKRERQEHLLAEPFCRTCEQEGRQVKATFVDHIEPPRGDEVSFFGRSNWQSLCREHSNIKTAHEIAARMNRRRPTEAHPGMVVPRFTGDTGDD